MRAALAAEFGPIDDQSEVIDFSFTDYYQPEMGDGLLRIWYSFAARFVPEDLVAAKLKTNELEGRFLTADGRRQVNLDPGILSLHNLVLATTKDYAHRIYLGRGIHAEVTLIFTHHQFQAQPWTYRDYQSPAALAFLTRVRDRYVREG